MVFVVIVVVAVTVAAAVVVLIVSEVCFLLHIFQPPHTFCIVAYLTRSLHLNNNVMQYVLWWPY